MTAYSGLTRTTLGQLCTTLWDSQSHPVVIQPGIGPDVVMPLALRCSALDHCATRFISVCLISQIGNFTATLLSFILEFSI